MVTSRGCVRGGCARGTPGDGNGSIHPQPRGAVGADTCTGKGYTLTASGGRTVKGGAELWEAATGHLTDTGESAPDSACTKEGL